MNITGGIIFVCLSSIAFAAKNINPRVLSSKLSTDIAYPFEAMVIIDRKYACTATLITTKQLITVAQCVAHVIRTNAFEPTVKIRIGSIRRKHGTTYRARRISLHVGFSMPYTDFYIHDIAVIHTVRPITTSYEVQPIGLPIPNSDVLQKVLVIFSSLAGEHQNNHTLPPLLLRVIVNTKPIEQCPHASYTLIKEQLCIEVYPDFQYGPVDMGSPMIDFMESTILGIGSAGYDNYGLKGIPTIFTKVSEYIPYILEEISYGTSNYSTPNPPPAINFVWNDDEFFVK